MRRLIILIAAAILPAFLAGSALAAVAHPVLASGHAARGASQQVSSAWSMTPVLPSDLANTSPTGPTEQDGVIDGINVDCFNIDGAVVEYVDADNVHIWNYPGGSWEYEINKDAWFDSSWMINNEGPYHCVSDGIWKGSYWVYGFRNAIPSNIGWIGLQYLHIESFYD